MRFMLAWRALGPIDLKNIRRDPLLAWVIALPLVLALLLRYGLPWLLALAQNVTGRDFSPYAPFILAGYLMTTAPIAGMVVGFLFLDERDAGTLAALLVTPLPAGSLLAYRLSLPVLAGSLATMAGYSLIGWSPLPGLDLLAVSFLGALAAPQIALFLVGFAPNKVAGFALVKIVNALLLLPVAAFFLPAPLRTLFGLIPFFWPLEVFWRAQAGAPYGPAFIQGLTANGLALALLVRRFWRQLM